MSRTRSGGRSRAVVVAILAGLAISIAPAARPGPVHAAPPSGPVAQWLFDETSGTTADDAVGTHDGSLLGNPTWSPSGGHEGGALVFDGVGDGVEIPSAAALEPASASVLMWMKGARTDNAQFDTLIQKGANACEAGSWGLQASGRLPGISPGELVARGDLAPADGGYWLWASPEAALWNGSWHLVAWTFDNTTNTSRLYVDGIASQTSLGSLLYGLPTSDLFIGREPTDCPDSRDFQGALDDVRVYDRALSASEIQAQVPAVATAATLDIMTSPVQYGEWTWANVTVTPSPVEALPVRIYDVTNGGHVLVGINGVSPLDGVGRVQINSNPLLGIGSHELVGEVEAVGPYAAATTESEAFVVNKIANTASLEATPDHANPGDTVQLDATVSNYSDGIATFYEDLGGGVLDSIGTAPLVFANGPYTASIQTPQLDIGNHTFLMQVSETDHFAAIETDPVSVPVAVVPTTTLVGSVGPLQAHHPVQLEASVAPTSPIASPPPMTGDVTFRDGATTLGTVDVAAPSLLVPSLSVGSHNITAQYSGDLFYQGSTSAISVQEVPPDTVDAASVGVQYTTFYPYKDGYRDTNAIKGNRTEPLSVSIRIYNGSNHVVRSASLGRAAGAYSYAWNGRTSTGSILASGKYRIVQTLTDAYGTKKSWTSYATISAKKLVAHSTYVTKYAYPPAASNSGGTGKGYYSSTSRYLKLVAGSDGFVLAGWGFTLPSAAVYKSLKFQVYAKSPPTAFNVIAGQNFSWCALSSTWDTSCFDRVRGIGGSGTAWYSTTLGTTANRSGRTVRGLIAVQYGTVYVYKVRVYVSYATLQ